MNWKGVSGNCLSSDEGYLVRRDLQRFGYMFIARTPVPEAKIIYSGGHEDKAKAACVEHMNNQKVAA